MMGRYDPFELALAVYAALIALATLLMAIWP